MFATDGGGRSHFSISPTSGWQVVRYEIQFGNSEALLLSADRYLVMTQSSSTTQKLIEGYDGDSLLLRQDL